MDFTTAYLNSFGLAALIAVAFGVSLRLNVHPLLSRAFIGSLFGAAAALAMRNPILITEGVFIDPRNLFVGLSAAFLGPVGALMCFCIAAIYRILMGGLGVSAGLLSMAIAASAGLAWAHLMRNKACTRPQCLLLLGGMISFGLVGTLVLPREAMIALIANAGPYVVGFNLVGAVLFGSLMERERITAHRFGQLKAQATTDPLTGLLNRRGFNSSVARFTGNGRTSATAILIIDLDHFKSINDTLGHEIGDVVLAQVAEVLKQNVRKKDLVSRFGGEEFVVLLPDTNVAEARDVGERLRLAVGQISLTSHGKDQRVSTSVGGFWTPANFDQLEGLRKADRALYRAKQMGRNRTEFFNSDAIAA
ncbi:MAG: diguanylate cyclase [Afipia sp.]|nr:diguanylate cyclase [Afipia sp.]